MKLLHYQKPVLWVLLGTVLACIAAAVLFLVNPFGAKGDALLLQVLNNKETFIKESGEAVSLQAYIQSASNDAASAPQRYTLVDLDGDGEEELVAYIDCDGGKYLIFHIYDGKVYGFAFAGRDFQNLKTDGTFVKNNNSYTNYFYTLEFDKTAYRLTELAYHNPSKAKARLGGQEATEQEATVFAVEFWKKPAVQWTAVGEAADPIPLYREFLDGKATAEEDFAQKKLSDYIPSSGAYEYAFYDMTGDGQAELCVSSVFGIDIFTVQNSSLQHWYTGETSEARLMENGMVLEESYEYDLSAMYYSYQGLTERGQTMFSLHFSWTDVKYTYPDMYTFNRLEVTQEEYQKKTEEYFALKEMAGEAVTGNTKPANYDSLLLQVLNNKKTFYNEDGKAVYLKDHAAASDPFGLTSASRYTLVDMDGDGTNEMVVSFLPNGAYGSYTVFRVHKRQVYGYDFPYNSMQSLKTDGAFMKKDTHSNTYYLTLTFEDTGYQIHELAYCNSAYHADRVCRIGGKAVTLEEVTAYRKEFTLKPDAVWETAPLTDEGNTYALYQAFLAGETKAKQDDGNEYFFGTYLLADSDTFNYTLLDMTGDGQPELLVKLTYNLHIFTVKDGQVCLWSTVDALRYTLLNNGAFLYERHGAAPENIRYEYRELDENGEVKFDIAFAWYDGTTVEEGVVHPDRYEINYQEVTKAEYEEKVLKYLQIGSDKIIWYPQAEEPETPVTGTDAQLLMVLHNETPFINEAGVQVYMAEHKIDGIAAVPEQYTLVDMDDDGTNELVVYVTPEYGAYLVLRLYENQIYGYGFPGRGMMNLTADGAFVRSGGAGLHSYVTLTFDGTGYALQENAYSDVTANVYRIDGKDVTSYQADAFIQDFYEKPLAIWYVFEARTDTDYKALYLAFLADETTALDENGEEQSLDAFKKAVDSPDTPYTYTFLDMTGDEVPELCVYEGLYMYFFTVKDGRVQYWHTEYARYLRLLNDGAFLYLRQGAAPTHRVYRYYRLDENAAVEFEITFSWYDGSTIEVDKVYPDIYKIDNKEVSKEEYEEITKPYLGIGYDAVVWYSLDQTTN